MQKLSAVIITFNEEENIARTLQALQNVVDEIIIVDSFSEDRTVEISKKMGAMVVQKKWEGYSINKNYGNSLCKNDWVLSLDADEVLSDELAHSIRNLKMTDGHVYSFNRLTNYCGTWIRHCGWHSLWLPRLFNRKEVCWQGDFVHEILKIPTGHQVIGLKGLLLHYSYKDAQDHLQRIEVYSRLAAEELFREGQKTNFYLLHIRPLLEFFRIYFIKRGILDGIAGFLIAWRDVRGMRRKYQILEELNE